MRYLESEKTFLLITSTSKDTLILKNTSSHIVITLLILGMNRPTLPLNTQCWWNMKEQNGYINDLKWSI